MKYRFIIILTSCMLVQSLWALGGIGFYGNTDIFSATPMQTSEGDVTITPESIENPFAGGVTLYLDVIPFVDLQADIEVSNKKYDFTNTVGGVSKTGTFQYLRFSQYYTIRKEVIGFSIPLLAKAQLYGGGGINMHTVTPSISVDFIKGAFAMSLNDAVGQDFTDNGTLNDLVAYMDESKISSTGYHMQLGVQGKLLVFNLFANARYTMVKDVVPGKNGFASLWVGLAYGI